MAVDRDPEVALLARASLKLVVQAEMIHEQLIEHQAKVADFLERAHDYTVKEAGDDRREG